jgi:hypothetical protein
LSILFFVLRGLETLVWDDTLTWDLTDLVAADGFDEVHFVELGVDGDRFHVSIIAQMGAFVKPPFWIYQPANALYWRVRAMLVERWSRQALAALSPLM